MKYEFRANGEIKIDMSPTNNLEETFFKELFSDCDEVKVTKTPDGKTVTITKTKKE